MTGADPGGPEGTRPHRATKIVATLGPATSSEAALTALIRAGVDVVRLNFSHGTHEEHAATYAMTRAIAQRLGRPVAVLQDLQGPKIRTDKLVGGAPVTLRDGAIFRITTEDVAGTAERVGTTYPHLRDDVKTGDTLLLDDGRLELRVTGIEGAEVVTTVVHGGALGEHKGINLPGVHVSVPALTEKDLADLAFGVALGVDYVALSFVRTPHDLRLARAALKRLNATTPLIAKIEKPEALDDLPGVIDAADGVMVARGDLGVELSPERVPSAQKRIIRLANARGKVVITATQMLESMTTNPEPTRAEASDVFNAILDGTDAVMLSGETAIGSYPVETVQMMQRIAAQAEIALPDRQNRGVRGRQTTSRAIAEAAVQLACDVRARALVVVTRSGYTARLVSSLRPPMPILVLTQESAVYHSLALWWGLQPLHGRVERTADATIAAFEHTLIVAGHLRERDLIVIVGSSARITDARTNVIKLHIVGRQKAKEG
ncbi:MAG: pyruvate kinase [Thermomicrobia bacterium]|nr:pyruvate kinase [Thermomicrobia bacterium]MCA1723065.1 pyruvate kinase [Thermomicrobia bacterium]